MPHTFALRQMGHTHAYPHCQDFPLSCTSRTSNGINTKHGNSPNGVDGNRVQAFAIKFFTLFSRNGLTVRSHADKNFFVSLA
jgi:hypothetical protein